MLRGSASKQRLGPDLAMEPAFRRNGAAGVDSVEVAHNPEVAGSNPAPATAEGPGNGAFLIRGTHAVVSRLRHKATAKRSNTSRANDCLSWPGLNGVHVECYL